LQSRHQIGANRSHGKITMIFQAMGATDGDSSLVWRRKLIVLVFCLLIAPCLPDAVALPYVALNKPKTLHHAGIHSRKGVYYK